MLQRYVVRLLLMVPIYSITSWVSMVSLTAAQFLDPIRDIYEAFTIYAFFQLLINYMSGERALIILTHGRAPVQHLWPLNHVLPKVDISDPYTFLAIKRGILQYAWLKPIMAIAAIVMKATGTYQEGYIAVTSGYFWESLVYNLSVTVSLYALGLFWVCMHNDLLPFRPVPKFLCIKLIIFASYWQGFLLSVLVWLGAIPDNVEGYTPDNLAAAIQDALICCEMPGFAVAHWYAFSWHDYADNNISSARMPVKYAMRDAFGVIDLIEDSKETFKGDKYNYRVFDSSGKVIAHEDSSSRFARLKDGMRYKRSGEAKYWVPKPGEVRGELSANTPLLSSNGGPSGSTPTYSSGAIDETDIDADDENLYSKARELKFGDWNVCSHHPPPTNSNTDSHPQYPVITAHVPARERWVGHASVYQSGTGSWNAASSRPSLHSGGRSNKSSGSVDTLSNNLHVKGKDKERKRSSITGPSPGTRPAKIPQPAAEEAESSQANGPLGAPVLSTSDPQVLLEEAEEEEPTFLVGDPTPDEESGPWNSSGPGNHHDSRSPLYGGGGEDEFRNPWEHGQK